MYHSIIVRRTKTEDDELVSHMTFKTSDIKEITVQRDATGLPIRGWLSTDTVSEGETSCVTFTREHNEFELNMLDQLARGLEVTQSYFEDEQGNIFPFKNIVFVNSSTYTLMMQGNNKIVLHPTNEWPEFRMRYINWLDLTA